MGVYNFAILAFVDPIQIVTTPSGIEIVEGEGHGSLRWTPGGTSEGTRLGEVSRKFVLEGHRVSCLVPTSGESGRGVNFGDS